MMNAFFQSVARALETDEVGFETDFRAAAGRPARLENLEAVLAETYGVRLDGEGLSRFKTVGDLYREAFLTFAAEVLNVPRRELSPETAYGTLPAWDSVNHLRLAMEAERRFGVRYPLEKIPGLMHLADFIIG